MDLSVLSTVSFSNIPTAVLTLYDATTGQFIGTMTNQGPSGGEEFGGRPTDATGRADHEDGSIQEIRFVVLWGAFHRASEPQPMPACRAGPAISSDHVVNKKRSHGVLFCGRYPRPRAGPHCEITRFGAK